MRNRYGDEYSFVSLDSDIYAIVGNLNYWRYGGHPEEDEINENNLGFVDPSGGPFLEVGAMLPGTNRRIKRIFVKNQICFEVE